MAKRLTDVFIKNVKPDPERRVEYSDTAVPGFRLVVTPTGAKSYAFRFKLDGKAGNLTIGKTTEFTLDEARQEARDAIALIGRGIDPAKEKQDKKQARIADRAAEKAALDNLAENAFERFIELHAGKRKSGHEIERLLRVEVIPVWKGRKIESITRRDVIALTDAIAERGAPTTANRVLANVRKAFNWFLGRDYAGLAGNPCAAIAKPAEEVERDRVLADDEIRLVLRAADRMGAPWGPFVRLLLFTGVRRDEAASAPWSEFALDGDAPSWSIPKERTKNGKPHLVPLASSVAEMMRGVDHIGEADLVFTTTGETPVSGFAKMKARLDRLMLELARKDAEETGGDAEQIAKVTIRAWRLHDLRRTAATGMAGMGVAPHIVEAVLNHISGAKASVAGIYNRAAYEPEKRTALTAWAARLGQIERQDAPGAKVIPIQRKK